MNVLVGCPVFEREWALDAWFDSVQAQELGKVSYVFAYTPSFDNTLGVIRRRSGSRSTIIPCADVPSFRNADRHAEGRYEALAELRNRLLSFARLAKPDWFLSWDSDITLEPWCAHRLIDDPDRDVTGALVDMLGENWLMTHPSVMDFHERLGAERRDALVGEALIPFEERYPEAEHGPFKVDVVMAVKALSPRGYGTVPYVSHPLGEDIGFSLLCDKAGIDRWLHPNVVGEHAYERAG